jgi:hypothetical protein
MIAITVSTKYDDLLNIILPQNAHFFEKWYIITDPNDHATIQVINTHNLPQVEVVYYDFYANGKTFNKGGAIRHCQESIQITHTQEILLLDSDIYLPDHFSEIMAIARERGVIQENTLYGTSERHHSYSQDHLINGIVDYVYPYAQMFQGYFQLYIESPNHKYLYDESTNCAECDLKFIEHFRNLVIIENLTVFHLGKSGVHWNTRTSKEDFSV